MIGMRRGAAARPVAEPRILLLPAVAWFALLLVVPLVIMGMYSLAHRVGITTYEFGLNWGNFGRLADPIYLKIFRQTFTTALLGTLGCLVIAYPFAYWLATRASRRKSLILLLVIVPFWTSILIRTYAWALLLNESGPISDALQGVGLIAQPLQILYTPRAVLIGMIYDYLPLMIFPVYVSIERLDRRLLEASRDLGASRLATFRRVTFPLTKPGIITGSLLVFIPMMGEYVVPAILGGAKSFTLGSLIGFQFLSATNWPFGAAISMALILLMLVTVALYLRAIGRSAGDNLEASL